MRPLRSGSCRSLPRPRGLAAIALLLLATVCASPCLAGWTGGGLPITALPGDQSDPAIVPDGAGGLFVSWLDKRPSPLGGCYLVRLTPDGEVASGWTAGGLLVAESGFGPHLVSDEAGGVFLDCATCFSPTECYAYVWHIGSTGDSLGRFGMGRGIELTTDSRGGVLSLNVAETNMTHPICVTRVPATDSLGWAACMDGHQDPWWQATCPDQAGGAYVVWPQGIQRFDSTGAVASGWPVFPLPGLSISATVPSDGNTDLLVPSAANGAIVIWSGQGTQPGDLYRLYAARVHSDGFVYPAEQQLTDDSSSQYDALAVPKGGGGAVLAWRNYLDGVGPAQVYAVVLPAFGDMPRTSFPVAPSPWDQQPLDVAWDGATGGYVVWVGRNTAGDTTGLYVQRFTGAGIPSPGWPEGGVRVCAPIGGQITARLAVSDGQPYVVWHDPRRTATDPGAGYDVYVARLTPDGTVPVLMSLVEANPGADGVRLRWWAVRGPEAARVQRSADGAAWSEIGGTTRDGLGYYAFIDRATAPGDRFAYRLATSSGEPLCAASWVSIPAGARLALGLVDLGASPPTVQLTLASDAPARLEVFDVQGRRIETLNLAARGAGEHVVALRGAAIPGVYLLRLSQAGVSVTRRGLCLR